MVETILLAFLTAKLKKYKILPIFFDWAAYPILFFAGLYIGLQVMIFRGDYSLVKYASLYKTLYLVSFSFLIIRYRQVTIGWIGTGCMLIGSLLNTIVMRANGGKMPIFPRLSYVTGYTKPGLFENADAIHVVGNEATKLTFLADIFDIGYCIMSVGDIIMRVYVFLVVYHSIKCMNGVISVRSNTHQLIS